MSCGSAIQKQNPLAGASMVLLIAGIVACSGAAAQSTNAVGGQSGAAFGYDERSTVSTIPFESMDQDALSGTAIEGGLSAPAEGVPSKPINAPAVDYYLDPLSLQPDDDRTDLGRHEIPAEIRFSSPKNIPGQTRGNDYVIRPPAPRNIEGLNTNVQGRP